MKKQRICMAVINLLIFASMIVLTAVFLNKMEWYMQALAYTALSVFTAGSLIFSVMRREALARSLFVFNIVAALIISLFAVLSAGGIMESLSDMGKIKEIIVSAGAFGYLIYSFILILNVVVLPMPGFVFILAGVAIYGPYQAILINYVCTVAGSVIAFFIGRIFGYRAVVWCVGREATEKYTKMLGIKGNLLFVIMQALPFFPDDILCMVAGLTKMRFRFFLISMLAVRPLYIVPVSLLGTGNVIPLSGWGIPVWIAIFAVIAVVFLMFCKYQLKIEEMFGYSENKENESELIRTK